MPALQVYRLIDFKRPAQTVAGTVERLEYDPNRSARIALIRRPAGISVNQKIGNPKSVICYL